MRIGKFSTMPVVLLLWTVLFISACAQPTTGSGQSDSVSVEAPVAVFLGQDCILYGKYFDQYGNLSEAGTWSFISGPAGAPPTLSPLPYDTLKGTRASAIFTETGLYHFKYTKGSLEKTAAVYVYPTVGPEQTVALGDSATMAGLARMDESHVTVVGCTKLGISISNNGSDIIFAPTATGVFEFTYTVWKDFPSDPENAPLLAQKKIILTVTDREPLPSGVNVSAGADRAALVGETITLLGSAEINGVYFNGTWFSVGNPGGITLNQLPYDDVAQNNPLQFSASQPGEYLLKYTGSTYSDLATVRVYAAANAGPDQGVVEGTTVTLTGSSPSGLPINWTEITSGGMSLTNPGSTTATFIASAAGTYEFSYTIYADTALTQPLSSDTVVITVAAPPPPGSISITLDLIAELALNTYVIIPTAGGQVQEIVSFLDANELLTFYGNSILINGGGHFSSDWVVEDAGFPRLVLSPETRILNTSAPVKSADALTMPGYVTVKGVAAETWLNVAAMQPMDLAGKKFSFHPQTYTFNPDGTGVYENSYMPPAKTFTWTIDSYGKRVILKYDMINDGYDDFYFTARGLGMSVSREIAILHLHSSRYYVNEAWMNDWYFSDVP